MNRTNLLLDTGIFIAFLIAMEPHFSGVAIHEWLSISLAAAILFHLLLHWKWIVGISVRFFQKLWHTSRLKFVVDTLLFIAFVAVMLSGLLISRSVLPSLGVQLDQVGMEWRRIHSLSADLSVLLVGLHFALNWDWIVNTTKRVVITPWMRRLHPQPMPQPVPVRNHEDY